MDSKAFSVTAKSCRRVPGSQAGRMQIQERKEAKWGEFKGEVSLYYDQRCFPSDWNHLSLKSGGEEGWSHLSHWVLKMETATLESSRFCNTTVKTEAPRLTAATAPGHLAMYPPVGSAMNPKQSSAKRLHKHLQVRTMA